MFKIPKRLKIGGFIWAVKRDNGIAIEGNCYGSTHYKTQTIFVEPEPPCTQQKSEQCLIHEILHAVFWQTGLNDRVEHKLEEEIVTALAHGLYQVLIDNRWEKR